MKLNVFIARVKKSSKKENNRTLKKLSKDITVKIAKKDLFFPASQEKNIVRQ